MDLQQHIIEGIHAAFIKCFNADLSGQSLALQPTKKEFAGTYTFVTFPFLKTSRKNPEETGKIIGAELLANCEVVTGYNVVKGFLNIELSQTVWVDALKDLVVDDNFGFTKSGGDKIMVEYSSPNTNKPLHLGHLRNNFLGYSVSAILSAHGHEVIMANLINDRGIHICKSMIAYEKFGNGETPESAGIKGDHLVGNYYVKFDQEYKKEIESLKAGGQPEEEAKKNAPLMLQAQEMLQKWEQGDEAVVALWKQMNSWVYAGFEDTYNRIGVNFDQYYYESDTYLLGKDLVEEGLKQGVFFKKDDKSVWVDLSDEGLDEKLVLRGDGTSVYMTQDMGTADLKYKDYQVDKSIYVVGNEQDYHFKVLQLILKKLGRPYAEGIYHLSYGMVDLPSGKMKSREGTVVDADDLVQEMVDTARERTDELGKIDGFTKEEAEELYQMLALGALKYYLLRVDPKKRMMFNPEESIDFHGNTGPFIQYSHARIIAILRKADELGITYKTADQLAVNQLEDTEQALIEVLVKYPQIVAEAGKLYSPSTVAAYAYDVAKEYNRFYAELSIFNEEDETKRALRVVLSYSVAKVLKSAMALLGIQVPDRM